MTKCALPCFMLQYIENFPKNLAVKMLYFENKNGPIPNFCYNSFLFGNKIAFDRLVLILYNSVQFNSVQLLIVSDLYGPMNQNMPCLPVHHQRLEFTQKPCPSSQWCHPAISSSVVPLPSCHQSLPASRSFQWVNSSHEVAKVLEFQPQHQSFQWIPRTGLL